MQHGERQNVYKVYDKIAGWFAENRSTVLIEKDYLDFLIAQLRPAASVLDLGCGTGKPILEYLLNKGLQVTGVDASSKLLAIAKSNFPSTRLILQDMRQLELNTRFDAVIAWNSFFHLPADDQSAMFPIFAKHLKPSGFLLFTSGTERGEAWGINGGENVFHASLDSAEYEQLLWDNKFEVAKHVISDPNCGHATVWLAKLNKIM